MTINDRVEELLETLPILPNSNNRNILVSALTQVARDQREACVLAAQQVVGVEGIAAQRLNKSIAAAIRNAKTGE